MGAVCARHSSLPSSRAFWGLSPLSSRAAVPDQSLTGTLWADRGPLSRAQVRPGGAERRGREEEQKGGAERRSREEGQRGGAERRGREEEQRRGAERRSKDEEQRG